MKKALIISLIVLTGLAGSAMASGYTFMPFYLINGQVADAADGSGVTAAGRQVVFFREMSEQKVVSVYTIATIDEEGKFMVNASTNLGLLPLIVGEKCWAAVVKGADGYGADPVEVIISGLGFDAANGLVMALGAGVTLPDQVVNEPAPRIKLYFGNRLYQPALVSDDDPFVISSRTSVKADITIDPPYTLAVPATGVYSIVIDEGVTEQRVLELKAENVSRQVFLAGSTPEEGKLSALSMEFNITDPLNAAPHIFSVRASSSGSISTASSVTEYATVEVMGGPVRVIGAPLTHPSPYSPSKDKIVTIQYELSKDADIQIVFTAISGQLVRNFIFAKGTEGGSAGVNKVTWDGRTDRGTIAGNGIYLGTIVSQDDKRKLGTIKLTVVD
jgi:hypothetical protein